MPELKIASSEYIKLLSGNSQNSNPSVFPRNQIYPLCVFAQESVRIIAAALQLFCELVRVKIGQNCSHNTWDQCLPIFFLIGFRLGNSLRSSVDTPVYQSHWGCASFTGLLWSEHEQHASGFTELMWSCRQLTRRTTFGVTLLIWLGLLV